MTILIAFSTSLRSNCSLLIIFYLLPSSIYYLYSSKKWKYFPIISLFIILFYSSPSSTSLPSSSSFTLSSSILFVLSSFSLLSYRRILQSMDWMSWKDCVFVCRTKVLECSTLWILFMESCIFSLLYLFD